MRLSATEYGGHLYSTIPCVELVTVLGAGEWRLAVTLPIPALDRKPDSPPAGYWVMLERGPETLFAQLSGDPYCSGTVTRSSAQSVLARGVVAADGTTEASQERCFAAEGIAEITSVYWGPGDLRATLEVTVLLRAGRHALDPGRYELTIGRSQLTRRDLYQQLLRQFAEPSPSAEPEISGTEFVPDEKSTAFVTITSVDPLVAEVELNDLRDADGRSQSFRAGFRCDLAEHRLTAAAAATPRPTPTPTPAPLGGKFRLEVRTGPVAGIYEADSAEEITCSLGLFREDEYMIQYAPAAEDAELTYLQLTLANPEGGEGAVRFRLGAAFRAVSAEDFGTFYSISTLDSPVQGSGKLTLSRAGQGIRVKGSARAPDGVQLVLDLQCREVTSF